MPQKLPNEKKADFISRCMSHEDTQKWDSSQRYAICLSMFEKQSQAELNEAIQAALKESDELDD